MKQATKSIVGLIAALLVMIFSVVMLSTIRQYFSFETNVGFLKFKQQVVNNKYWLFFFYIHIFSILLCLLAGITQFSGQLLTEHTKIHRFVGRIYVYNILFINVPACFVLGLFSNGGLLGVTGFLVQDGLWAFFTMAAVHSIRRKNIKKHRNFMVLSYAITTTALTFRIVKNLIYDEKVFSYTLFYGVNVWLALLINLTIAYFIISYGSKSSSEREIIADNGS